MTPHTGKLITTIRILLNISRSKDNHTMKLDHQAENDMRNIFLKKSYAVPDLFLFFEKFI